ncbi:MAG: type II toxin-antitoxin system VapC family toxin [Blastocatellia bacterium]
MPRIYLDTCIVIYVVERHPLYTAMVEARLQSLAPNDLCYSPLVRMECLVKPFKDQDASLLQLYESFLGAQQMLDLPRVIFDAGARLRAAHPRLKTPDAIHLAAAVHHGCTEFWTNDDRLNAIAPGLAMKVI